MKKIKKPVPEQPMPEMPGGTPVGEPVSFEEREQQRKTARLTGGFLLVLAAVLVLLGAWMFIMTRGTHLLRVSATTGQLYRQFPVFLILGAVIALIAAVILKKNPGALPPPGPLPPPMPHPVPAPDAKPGEMPPPPPPEPPRPEPPRPEVPRPVSPEAPPPAPKKRFCTNCGAELGAADRFCLKCGTPADTAPADLPPAGSAPAGSAPDKPQTPPPPVPPQA